MEEPANQLEGRMHKSYPGSFSVCGHWSCCCCCALQAYWLAVCLNKNRGSCISRLHEGRAVRHKSRFAILRQLMCNRLWRPICCLCYSFQRQKQPHCSTCGGLATFWKSVCTKSASNVLLFPVWWCTLLQADLNVILVNDGLLTK